MGEGASFTLEALRPGRMGEEASFTLRPPRPPRGGLFRLGIAEDPTALGVQT